MPETPRTGGAGYTDLRVSPPNISMVFTVPATIDACRLQLHPVTEGSQAADKLMCATGRP